MLQSLSLGAAFVGIAAASDCAYVLMAELARPAFVAHPRNATIGRAVTALVYFGLGLCTAFSGVRTSR